MSQKVFALVDCNNFYASCEKLFRPDLKYKPVAVLSNNDGCIVARSKEVKALGIKMGVPVHQVQEQIKQHQIVCFSSNYALYADMSQRVMSLLEAEAPEIEIYSIDEAFLKLTGVEAVEDLLAFGQRIKAKVDQCTGITVGVGIAPTKTLAKLANHAAKTYPATGSVVNLMDPARQRRLLALLDVSEVWGVGRRLSKRLQEQGIHTALDLADTDPKLVRREYSVVLERTIRELNGISCLSLESLPATKKQILCSRSFGSRITERAQLKEAIAKYVTRAAEKLRAEGCLARVLQVFIRTGMFNASEPQYRNALTIELTQPTDDTRAFLKAAFQLFDKLFRPGFRYAKAGVMLTDFYSSHAYQADLFHTDAVGDHGAALMAVMDNINQSGHGQVFFAAQGLAPEWSMKRQFLSPAYTTQWSDLPSVR
ncbi:DNA polymerase IV [Marinomonas aquimarina]|uniref:DNA polymerase IV n=1 Tax=Marinomonas aquimarina TaxID=295068 RepID=A0A1A8TEM0_9GAMM|nr:translesion error-prone DNA polymerase V subunit UmuC [Marinomonas aquimarina]SBS30535.1 DNA polymerase IV [Marinomonas aquimarina]